MQVFHAGTALRDGELVTAGGRVLTLVGEDRPTVLRAAQQVRLREKQFRSDIGLEVAEAVVR